MDPSQSPLAPEPANTEATNTAASPLSDTATSIPAPEVTTPQEVVTSTPATPVSQEPAVAPISTKLLNPHTKLLKFCAGFAALLVAIFCIGMITTMADFVSLASNIVGFGGALFALLFGIYTGKRMLFDMRSNEATGGSLNGMMFIGLILIVLGAGVAFTGIPFISIGVLPGFILFYIGLHKNSPASIPGVARHYKTITKIALVLLGFLAGALPALILAAFGYFALWSRWCQLTSAKCM